MRVAVELPVPTGFSVELLTGETEAQLTAAGVKLLQRGYFPTGDPHLGLAVAVSSETRGLVAVHVRVGFAQVVFLRRDPQLTFSIGQTWEADGRPLIVPSRDVRDAVRRELARQVDQFIEDCRAANRTV